MGTVITTVGDLLKKKKMTEKALAERTGLNPRTVHDLVKGNYERIGLTTIALLCDALECKPADLFKYEASPLS